MKKDFVLTFLSQMIVLVSGLITYRLAMNFFGTDGFSEYSIIKRNLSYIFTFTLLGMGVALPRYVAVDKGKSFTNDLNILLASIIIVAIPSMVFGIISMFFNHEIAFLLFGSSSFSVYIFPLYISLIGILLHSVAYGFYRGKMIFNKSNALQVINFGVVPVVVFFVSNSLKEIFLFTGLLIFLVSFFFIFKLFFTYSLNMNSVKVYLKKLIVYGLQRLPADFGLASLLTLPVILSSHLMGSIQAGYVAFSISLLNMSGHFLSPIGLITLPKVSYLLGKKDYKRIKYYLRLLLTFSITIAIIGCSVYQLFAKQLLLLYLGYINNDLLMISKNIMWSVLFYAIFVSLRSVVDAYYELSYNSISIIVSLLVFLVVFFIGRNIYFAFSISLFILSVLTIYFMKPLIIGDVLKLVNK